MNITIPDKSTGQPLTAGEFNQVKAAVNSKADAGEVGVKGDKGDKGDTGDTGPKGDTGVQGPQGAKGDTGFSGSKGDTGATGPKGDIGATGAVGAAGAKGDKGDMGATGAGVPVGGAASQVLAKVTNADYDTHWVDAATGGGGVSGLVPKAITFGKSDGTIEQDSHLSYDKSTKTLINALLSNTQKAVLLGDSIGVGNASSDIANRSFFNLTCKALGLTPVNLAISNTRAADQDRSLIPVFDSTYKYLFIEFGTNDCEGTGSGGYDNVPAFTAAYNQLVSDVHAKGWPYANIVLLSIPGVFNSQLNTAPTPLAIQFNTVISNNATANGCIYADIWTPIRDTAYSPIGLFNYDYHHPNDAGHAIIASTLINLLVANYADSGQAFVGDNLVEGDNFRIRRSKLSNNAFDRILVADNQGNIGETLIFPDMQMTRRLLVIGGILQQGAYVPVGANPTAAPLVYDPAKDYLFVPGAKLICAAPFGNNQIVLTDPVTGITRFLIENSAGGWSFESNTGTGSTYKKFFEIGIDQNRIKFFDKYYFSKDDVKLNAVSPGDGTEMSIALLYVSPLDGSNPYGNTYSMRFVNDGGGATIFRVNGKIVQYIYPTGDMVYQKGGTYTRWDSSIATYNSVTQGFLMPRMTTAQRDAIASPAEGLEIYNLTTHKKNFYNGSAWEQVTSA